MFIRVSDWGCCYYDSYDNESEIGLKYSSYRRIEVIDKHLFMLAVIKHGIEFEVEKDAHNP